MDKDTSHIKHKIKKYVIKLQNTQSEEMSILYRKRLDKYYRINKLLHELELK